MPTFAPTQKPTQKPASAVAHDGAARAGAAGGRFEDSPLLWQRALGGRMAPPPSAAGIVQRAPAGQTPPEPPAPAPAPRPQGKCACGGTPTDPSGECDECRRKRLVRLQTKLTVGEPDDAYEREAERIAGQIAAAPVGLGTVPPRIQRLPAHGGGGTMAAPASVDRVLATPGAPLEPGLRREMEQRFGQDFRGVRIHQGPEADRSARDIDARAYTAGQHIGFGDGQFNPATPAGRRLLAHELTHVVQQSGAPAAGSVQRDPNDNTPGVPPPNLPQQLTRETARYVWTTLQHNYFQSEEIQWQASGMNVIWMGPQYWFDLLVVLRPEKRARLTSQQLASECAWTLFNVVSTELKNNGQGLMDYLAAEFDKAPKATAFVIPVTYELLREQFKGSAFDAYWANLKKYVAVQADADFQNTRTVMIAADSIPDLTVSGKDDGKGAGGGKPKYVPPPAWVTAKVKAVETLLAGLRRQPHDRPKDLPDRLVPWHNEHDDAWYLNVWVYFDVHGKEKASQAIRLQENESAPELLERVRNADQKALAKSAAEEEQRRQRSMPAWALQLKAKLEARLRQVTGGKPADNAPDRLSLAYGGPKAGGSSAPTVADGTPDQVLLEVWVGIGKEKKTGNQAMVPLFPTTEVEPLLNYVRQLAAVLRQNEANPIDGEVVPWNESKPLTLPPFNAKILALDLPPDRITVQGARNRFSMFLDFARQYGADDDLFIASKLFSQAFFLRWKVFPVPPERAARGPDGSLPAWARQWPALYGFYNPGGLIDEDTAIATHTAGSVDPPKTAPVYNQEGDITTSVELNGPPGDYLVYCETHHKPIGESGLRRVSSFAYYPVRTRSVDDLTTPQVTQTPAAIAAADANLKKLDELLAAQNLDPDRRKLLQAARASTQAQRDVLETRETHGLGETTAAEIRDGTVRLARARRLKAVLPDILKQAEANAAAGIEPSAPSKLLVGEPELLDLYWQLIREQKPVDHYVRELEDQLKELGKVHERAVDFQTEFKSDEATCVYSPEAVFLSEVDGHMYPLVLMVGEAPVNQLGLQVAYVVADVTSEQTKKSYAGYSARSGPEGHIEAIDRAFENFGEDATYGRGWIAVRMPRGPREECRALHRQGIQTYRSKEGTAQMVWRALGFLAAAVGIAALVATGFGAAVLGVLAVVLGAAVALHNIGERSARHTLAFDAEMGMDLLAILPVGELLAVRELSALSKAARGFAAAERLGRFIAVYRVTQMAAGFILIPVKAAQDIEKIKALGLPKDKEEAMIREVWSSALQGGLMFLAQVGAAHALAGGHGATSVAEERAALSEQAKLASLEETGTYKSLQEKGWLDEAGNLTEQAPEAIRSKVAGSAHPDAAPAAKPDPQRVEAAHKAVERVDHHEVTVEGAEPGKRHADLHDGHEIVEVQTESGIVCEYHSGAPVRVPCPHLMGGPAAEPAHPQGEPAAPAKGSPDDAKAAGHPDAPAAGGTETGPAEHPPTAAAPVEEMSPQKLVVARQQERAAQTKIENLKQDIKGKEITNADAAQLIEQKQDEIDAYRERNPKARPEDREQRTRQKAIENLREGIKEREGWIAKNREEIAVLEQQLADLADLKARYAGSKPWRQASLNDLIRGGLVGELEMSTIMQGEGFEPLGNTVRADGIVIPEDFENAVKNWRGKTGIDGIYRRPHPKKPGKFEYWVGESKTAGTPATREPTGTRGKLDTMKTGERQQSDQWIRDRVDSSGLSPAEAREIKEGLLRGEVKKFYAETDANGTRLYEIRNVDGSETDVLIGSRVVF